MWYKTAAVAPQRAAALVHYVPRFAASASPAATTTHAASEQPHLIHDGFNLMIDNIRSEK